MDRHASLAMTTMWFKRLGNGASRRGERRSCLTRAGFRESILPDRAADAGWVAVHIHNASVENLNGTDGGSSKMPSVCAVRTRFRRNLVAWGP
jgi:hypothetical protein